MGLLLRFVGVLLRLLSVICYPFNVLRLGFRHRKVIVPKNNLLDIPVVELAELIRKQEIKSEAVIRAYIERIVLVNPALNAIVEERFSEAIEDAKRADAICISTPMEQLKNTHPLLGVPFTVKESCQLKGMLLTGGSIPRIGVRAIKDGQAVANLKEAGAIPLCVTNTPEYCLFWECYNHVTGRTLNPYDLRRTSGGSSGGEGALLGVGASLFGVGSDLAGSIRMPAMFNGIFGHKPTGGAVSIDGHFPLPDDDKINMYLNIGPLTRFASDLPLLLQVMSGPKVAELRLHEHIDIRNLNYHYIKNAGFSFAAVPVEDSINKCMDKTIQYFKDKGLKVTKCDINMQETIEISIACLLSIEGVPDLLANPSDPKNRHNLGIEMIKSLFGKSKFTLAALFFYFMIFTKGFMSNSQLTYSKQRCEELKKVFTNLLGNNGVLFYPTFPLPALRHGDCYTKIMGVMYPTIFNVTGFPATHVPLGFNKNGLPVGIQVIAAPYQDRLCLAVAKELEQAFGGWQPVR